MKSSTIHIILVICLIVIAVLLTIIIMHRTSPPSPSPSPSSPSSLPTYNNILSGNSTQQSPKGFFESPISLKRLFPNSPYRYDSGYWLDPWYWWYGDDYYRRNRNVYRGSTGSNINNTNNTNNTYNYNTKSNIEPNIEPNREPNREPNPESSLTGRQQLIFGHITPTITNRLPHTQLIAPSLDSTFPLPTLSGSFMPEEMPLPSLMQVYSQPNSLDMLKNNSASSYNSSRMDNSASMQDNIASSVDIQASQDIGMQGNNPIHVPELHPIIAMQH